jgi:DNA-binding MarR family transcriptional regulator
MQMALLERSRDRLQRVWRWLKRRLRRSPLAQITQSEAVLTEVSRHPSCRVQDVSSRLSLPLGTTFSIMAQLEKAGLVRLSQDTILSNRIVAITAKGREELKR